MNGIPFRLFIAALLFLCILQSYSQEKDVVSIFLIGDSTMADYSDNYEPGKDYMQTRYPLTGWGQVFQPFFAKDSLKALSNLIQSDSVVPKRDSMREGMIWYYNWIATTYIQKYIPLVKAHILFGYSIPGLSLL